MKDRANNFITDLIGILKKIVPSIFRYGEYVEPKISVTKLEVNSKGDLTMVGRSKGKDGPLRTFDRVGDVWVEREEM